MQNIKPYHIIRPFSSGFGLCLDNNGIKYPVRLHVSGFCRCSRIADIKLFVNTNENLVYVLEKIWEDNEYGHLPNLICITDEKNNNKNSYAKFKLESLFEETLILRRYVTEYFKNYIWSGTNSVNVRHIVRSISSVCFCRNNLLDKEMSNAGFVIVANYNQAKMISHCFNKYCLKTETYRIIILKLANLHLLNRRKLSYPLQIIKSNNWRKNVKKSKYILIGLEIDRSLDDHETKHKYFLPFGKREWHADIPETSLECARRELYEEFNIQHSDSIWNYSQSKKWPQQIYHKSIMLYFLYLPENLSVRYYSASDTIYLDTN